VAFAADKTHAKNPQAPAQESAAVVAGADNFYTSDKVTREKVTFKNQYNLKVAGNLFIPKTAKQNGKRPAIVVGHPMSAVKEQSAKLYAQSSLSGDSSRCQSTCLSGVRAKASPGTSLRRISAWQQRACADRPVAPTAARSH
jgi:hypothetical protein